MNPTSTGWGPQDSVQLVYKWFNNGLWYIDITIVMGTKMVYKPTCNWGGTSCIFRQAHIG